tara:strand:+ start:375 stop:545 length:171 start_codon:yes stop_codon:yes gene_type:complete
LGDDFDVGFEVDGLGRKGGGEVGGLGQCLGSGAFGDEVAVLGAHERWIYLTVSWFV